MKNLFDQQIKSTFEEKLDSVHASDELKAKLMARIEAEGGQETHKTTTLTAISPEFVYKTKSKSARHTPWLVPALIASVLLCVSSLILNIASIHKTRPDTPKEETVIASHEDNYNDGLIVCDASPELSPEVDNQKDTVRKIVSKEELLKDRNTYSYRSRARRV